MMMTECPSRLMVLRILKRSSASRGVSTEVGSSR
jgi:hypothetical protein